MLKSFCASSQPAFAIFQKSAIWLVTKATDCRSVGDPEDAACSDASGDGALELPPQPTTVTNSVKVERINVVYRVLFRDMFAPRGVAVDEVPVGFQQIHQEFTSENALFTTAEALDVQVISRFGTRYNFSGTRGSPPPIGVPPWVESTPSDQVR